MADPQTTPIRCRPARVDDLADLTAIYNHYVTHTAVTFDVDTVSLADRADWLARFAASGPYRLMVAEQAGRAEGAERAERRRVVGYASSGPFRSKAAYRPSVEVSVYCALDVTGRGVGDRLYRALFAALHTEDVHRAYAGISLPNPASERLHQRHGFRPVGTFREVGRKFGRYWDVQWWERPMADAGKL